MSLFDIAFERVFENEGGFQKDAGDRGNWTGGQIGVGELKGTKFGISAMTYPDLDIENMTLEDAKAIYSEEWWRPLRMDLLPTVIQYQMFDAAINHGMRTATRILQRAAGAKADGIMGPKTRLAISNTDYNDLLLVFLAERLEFMTAIATWNRFGKGWARRIAHNLKLGTQDN